MLHPLCFKLYDVLAFIKTKILPTRTPLFCGLHDISLSENTSKNIPNEINSRHINPVFIKKMIILINKIDPILEREREDYILDFSETFLLKLWDALHADLWCKSHAA